MPIRFGNAGGGGGSGFALGPVQNEFADVAARNAYALANATWLALYNADRSFWIQVGGAAGNIQRRNAAGDDWENVTGIIRGGTGVAGRAGAAGGGAIEDTGIVLDLRSVVIAANEFVSTGLILGERGDTPVVLYQLEANALSLLWFFTDDLYDLPPSAAGEDSDVTDANRNALTLPESAGSSLSGTVRGGLTDANELLLAFTTDDADTHVRFWRYVPSEAQGGLTAAERAELTRLSGVESNATEDQTGAEVKALYEAQADTNAYTTAEKSKLGSVATGANQLIPYKIGNIYRAFADGDAVVKPGNTEGTVTESGITVAPVGWRLTRPETTAALPYVYDCHVYGYTTNGVFTWQFGTPNRTDRYIVPGGGGGSPDTAAQILAKLLTVDGSGSGLDADLLAGMTLAQITDLVGGFDLFENVTQELTGSLGASDRFLLANVNVAGEPNEYVTLAVLQAALVSLNYLTVSLGLATVDRANELIQAALAAAVTGNTETNITVVHNADGTLDFAVIYPNQVTQAEAEAGTSNVARLWTPQRVSQAIAALAPGGQSAGLNLAQVNARVQAGLMAAVTGNTETGITVTHNADGTIDFVVSAAPAQTHLNYVGVRAADTNVVVGDLTVSGMTAALTLPAYNGAAHLIYSYPTAQGAPSGIYLYQDGHRNTQNQSSTFGVTGTFQLGGEEHTWRATDDAQTGFGGYILEQAR